MKLWRDLLDISCTERVSSRDKSPCGMLRRLRDFCIHPKWRFSEERFMTKPEMRVMTTEHEKVINLLRGLFSQSQSLGSIEQKCWNLNATLSFVECTFFPESSGAAARFFGCFIIQSTIEANVEFSINNFWTTNWLRVPFNNSCSIELIWKSHRRRKERNSERSKAVEENRSKVDYMK